MKYAHIKALLKQETKETKKSKAEYIKANENALRDNLTVTRWNQYTQGKISKADAEKIAIDRAGKGIEKKYTADLEKLETAENAPDVLTISISVEWKKSSVWGYNPTATIEIVSKAGTYNRYTGYASGCGYDKESAAIASALRNAPEITKMLCDIKEKGLRKMSADDRKNASNHKIIGYGSGYNTIPALECGVGVSCFESIFNKCGLVRDIWNGGKSYDYYHFTKKGVK